MLLTMRTAFHIILSESAFKVNSIREAGSRVMNYLTPDYTPEIIDETERLVIREIGPADIPAYRHVVDMCEAGVDESLKGLPDDEFTARHRAYIEFQYGFYGYGMWGLFLKDTSALIGIAGVINGDASAVGEAGYAILPEYRGRGLCTEALTSILEYAKELGFKRIQARISPSNTVSLTVAKHFGLEIIPI